MMSFKIPGNKTRVKIWKAVANLANNKIKKHSDLLIDVTGVILPTPFTIIIKFTIVNLGKKYELVKQGKYTELYKMQSEGNVISAEEVNAEILIRSYITEAWEIN
jgi:hypothetical protein